MRIYSAVHMGLSDLGFCPAEPDHSRELPPIHGVEEALLRPDRHETALCHPP
jgi:hypothetical protein